LLNHIKKQDAIHLAFLILLKTKNTNTMGRGDIKTKKGKIAKASFGKSRPAKPVKKHKPNAEKAK
jgi:30S ribosomal protein S31